MEFLLTKLLVLTSTVFVNHFRLYHCSSISLWVVLLWDFLRSNKTSLISLNKQMRLNRHISQQAVDCRVICVSHLVECGPH